LGDGRELRPQGSGPGQPDQAEGYGCRDGDRHGEFARRDRAAALLRVPAVALAVGQIVDQINDARQQGEHDETQRRLLELMRAVALVQREQQAGEQQQVLGPLLGAHRDEQREDRSAPPGQR